MTIYYKATRPDGTDFRTGTVHYQVGVTLPALPTVDNPKCCTSDVYHVSTHKADTLIGGSWPCRLFEVQAEAVAEERTKRGVYTMTVLRELPAWEALGPNGRETAALIQRATQLTENETTALAKAWKAARGTAWAAPWAATRAAARDAARGAARDEDRDEDRDAAWDAARAAAEALVVRDLISTEHFNTLYAPWASAIK